MIPLAEPNLSGKEKEYVSDAIASGWVSGGGPYVERFEDMVAEACGKRHCVATITGTAALHAVMTALEFSGQISVPKHTFVASRNVLAMMGCSLNVVRDKISHDSAWLQKWSNLRHPAIEDAAPAIGRIPVSTATATTLSFNGNKTITTGQGGAILCDDAALAERCRVAIRQLQGGLGQFNYRMPNLNAAMGCAQMERLTVFLDAKRSIWLRYQEAFGARIIEAGPSRWMSLWLGDLPDQDVFESKKLWDTDYWCLPCSTNLTEADQDKVIKCVSSL